MKRLISLLVLLVTLCASAQPITNYLDNVVVENLVVTHDWFGVGVVRSVFNEYGVAISAPIYPSISFEQIGTGAHAPLGPGALSYGDVAMWPGGTVYDGFHFSDAVMFGGNGTPSGSMQVASDASFWGNVYFRGPNTNFIEGDVIMTGLGAFYGNGAGLTNVPCTTTGLSITQSLLLVSGGTTNLYTNAFANGLLIASGPVISAHGPSWVWPGGGYILWPGGSTILLP